MTKVSKKKTVLNCIKGSPYTIDEISGITGYSCQSVVNLLFSRVYGLKVKDQTRMFNPSLGSVGHRRSFFAEELIGDLSKVRAIYYCPGDEIFLGLEIISRLPERFYNRSERVSLTRRLVNNLPQNAKEIVKQYIDDHVLERN